MKIFTISLVSISVIHIMSISFSVASIFSGSIGSREDMVSIVTKGFKLSILGLATSTLCKYREEEGKNRRGDPRVNTLTE